MQLAESNATTDRYVCSCHGIVHLNVHRRAHGNTAAVTRS